MAETQPPSFQLHARSPARLDLAMYVRTNTCRLQGTHVHTYVHTAQHSTCMLTFPSEKPNTPRLLGLVRSSGGHPNSVAAGRGIRRTGQKVVTSPPLLAQPLPCLVSSSLAVSDFGPASIFTCYVSAADHVEVHARYLHTYSRVRLGHDAMPRSMTSLPYLVVTRGSPSEVSAVVDGLETVKVRSSTELASKTAPVPSPRAGDSLAPFGDTGPGSPTSRAVGGDESRTAEDRTARGMGKWLTAWHHMPGGLRLP